MYTKKVVLTVIDEYLAIEGSMEHYELNLDISDAKHYYSVKLEDLNLIENRLVDLTTYLEDELNISMYCKQSWKTVNDICNAFKYKIKIREEIV